MLEYLIIIIIIVLFYLFIQNYPVLKRFPFGKQWFTDISVLLSLFQFLFIYFLFFFVSFPSSFSKVGSIQEDSEKISLCRLINFMLHLFQAKFPVKYK